MIADEERNYIGHLNEGTLDNNVLTNNVLLAYSA